MSTLQPGAAWGEPAPIPPDAAVAATDAEARHVVEEALGRGEPVPPLRLTGGDLCRTLGGARGGADTGPEVATRCQVDLGVALVDGRLRRFVAHLAVRRGWWRGHAHLAMNAEFVGAWDVAPRAHPGDGVLDVVDAAVPVGERLKVRARLPAGDHLPHPAIGMRRERAYQRSWSRPQPLWLDGEHVGSVRTLSVRVEPGALTVYV